MATCGRCGAENTPEARFCNRCGTALLGASESRTHETRRVVTVLFADLVGSTALSERLDAEHWHSIQGRYFTALRGVIERHGGLVEKFIGDAVLAVFGAVVVHEDDALRAVRAAAEFGTALVPLNAELWAVERLTLELRTGVHTGEVVVAEDGAGEAIASGAPMAVAARLEQAARPDEVLLGPLTYELVRDAVRAEALADLALRGTSGPLTAYRLLALTGTEAHRRNFDAPLVGRTNELADLTAALARARDEASVQLVTIVGAAGVGKSRLVRAFLDGVAGPTRIARGRCLAYGDGITYWPLVEILRDLAGVEPTDTREVVQGRLAGLTSADPESEAISTVIGSLMGTSGEATSGDDIAWALRRTLTILTAQVPLVLVIEDIHWAEPALLDLLGTVIDRTQPGSLLLVCPTRLELFDRRSDWGLDRPNATRLDLGPLDGTATLTLLDALPGGAAVPAALRGRILTAAEGNPLFVEEMLGKLADDGALQAGSGGWRFVGADSAVKVPASVTALIAARIDGLERPERSVAERASVVGRIFELGAVDELSPPPEREGLSGRLLALIRKQLITPNGLGLDGEDAFRFRHVLIRDAAYERLAKSDRAELHERFAAWLARVTGDRASEYVEVLAHHLAAATEYRLALGTLSGDAGEGLARAAIERLTEAAEHATRVLAHDEAARLYQRALDILARRPRAAGPGVDVIELEARRAQALQFAGDPWSAVDAIRQTLTRVTETDATRAALLTERLASYLVDAGDEADGLAAAAAAVAFLPPDSPTRERALVLASLARLLMLAYHDDEGLEVCEAALSTGRLAGAEHEVTSVLVTQGVLVGRTDPRRGVALLEDAHREAERIGDVNQMFRADVNELNLLTDLRDHDGADAVMARHTATAVAAGGERAVGPIFYINASTEAIWASRLTRAIEMADRALELAQTGDNAVSAYEGRGMARALMGDIEAALADLKAARQAARRGATEVTQASLALDEGFARWWSGQFDEALLCLDAAGGVAAEVPLFPVLGQVYRTMVEASRAIEARRAGDAEHKRSALAGMAGAADAARRFAAAATQADGSLDWHLQVPLALLPGELARGTGRGELAAWPLVVEQEGAIGHPWFQAYAQWRYAQALVAHGADQARREDAIANARRLAERAEAGGLLRELVALAGAA